MFVSSVCAALSYPLLLLVPALLLNRGRGKLIYPELKASDWGIIVLVLANAAATTSVALGLARRSLGRRRIAFVSAGVARLGSGAAFLFLTWATFGPQHEKGRVEALAGVLQVVGTLCVIVSDITVAQVLRCLREESRSRAWPAAAFGDFARVVLWITVPLGCVTLVAAPMFGILAALCVWVVSMTVVYAEFAGVASRLRRMLRDSG